LVRLEGEQERLRQDFQQQGRIHSCYIDELLPEAIARQIYEAFPSAATMAVHKSIRENKRVAAQMDQYAPILEEIVYAFQDPRIVAICTEITGIKAMQPDELLYAGGISLMAKGNFLNPHLDNSHDHDQSRYRVLNLLYYVSPDWELENGGNLELWDKGVKGQPRTIVSRYNRLALMITNQHSYHSVSKVLVDQPRCCVSNYYFSELATIEQPYFHVTSFYGRPGEAVKAVLLQLDRNVRNLIRKIMKKGIRKTEHIYKKESNKQ